MTALNPLSPDPRYLGGQEGHHLRLLVTWGKLDEAKRLLDARNKIQAAFGARIFEMPPPYETGLPECIAVPTADILSLEPKELPSGGFQVAA